MDTELLLSIVLCLFIPILLLLLYLEKRARRVLASFLVGTLVCLGAYYLNSWVYSKINSDLAFLSEWAGPVCEELLKLISILLIAAIVNKGKRASVANSYAVGIGFCVVENFFYLATNDGVYPVWEVMSRGVGTGLMHAMSSIILGLGVFYARKEKKRKIPAILLTFVIAASYHCIFNYLVQGNTVMRLIGMMIPVITYIALLFVVKRDDVKKFFSDEET